MADEQEPTYEGAGEVVDLDDVGRFPSRAAAAVTLWLAGFTYPEIAQRFEYANAAVAQRAVEQAIAASADEGTKDQHRHKLGRQLDRLLQGVWTKAINPKNDEHISAVKTALQILEQRAKLFGLNAPAEVTVYTPTAQELEAWVAQNVEQQMAALPEEADVIDGEVMDE